MPMSPIQAEITARQEEQISGTQVSSTPAPPRWPRAILSLEMAGERLFRLLAGMQIDGLVFNCRGPAPAVAFASAFAGVMLEV